MTRRPLFELLRLPVRTAGIGLARCVDALVDDEHRLVGFEVACRDGSRRFLPFATTILGDDEIRVPSALVFLDARMLAYYRERTQSARQLGLRDAWVEADGSLTPALSAA